MYVWCCMYRVKDRSRVELEYDADVSRTNVMVKTIMVVLSVAATVAVLASPAGPPAAVAVISSGGAAAASCCDLGFECVRLSSLENEISSRRE